MPHVDEGADGVEGAGATGQQVGPVVGVQQADVVGAVGLGRGPLRGRLAGTCCIAPPSDTGPPSSAFTRRCQRCSSRLRQGLPGLGSANPSPQAHRRGTALFTGPSPVTFLLALGEVEETKGGNAGDRAGAPRPPSAASRPRAAPDNAAQGGPFHWGHLPTRRGDTATRNSPSML